MSDYFPIDKMPKELIFGMLDQYPSLIKSLHATSRRFRSIVNEYLDRGRKQAAVQRLKFAMPPPVDEAGDPRGDIQVRAYVPSNMAGLFELRMNRLIAIEGASLRIRRVSSRVPLMYSLTCASVETARFLARDVIGTHTPPDTAFARLEEVIIREVNDARILEILRGRTFAKLCMFAVDLQDGHITDMNLIIGRQSVQELHLIVEHAGLTDPRRALCQLAAGVRSFVLIQQSVTIPWANTTAYLLGVFDADWSEIIRAMYASGRLEKLYIDNTYYRNYLSLPAADALRAALPHLGRPIHFTATCACYEDGLDETAGDYKITAQRTLHMLTGHIQRMLEVKHHSIQFNSNFIPLHW